MTAKKKAPAAAAVKKPKPASVAEVETAETLQALDVPTFHVTTIHAQDVGNDFLMTFTVPAPSISSAGTMGSVALAKVVCALTASPQTAKDMALLLAGLVAKHEERFGVIETSYTKRQAAANAKTQALRH